MEIDKDSVIEDVLREHPECIDVFEGHGMPCRTCMMVSIGTLCDGAVMHDIDLDTLIAELRACVDNPISTHGEGCIN